MRAGPEGLVRIAALIPGVSAKPTDLLAGLKAMVAGDMRLPGDVAEDLHPCLLLAATHPEQHGPAFEAATALLLGDLLMGGLGPDDLGWHWEAFDLHYRAADAPVRAALMQGFALAGELGLSEIFPPPAPADLRTFDPGAVTRALLRVARRLRPDEIADIAALGPAEDRERHAAALRAVLGRRGGYFPPGEPWYPGDVVEAAAGDPTAPGHAACLALVCLNALADRDAHGTLAALWAGGAAGIRALSRDVGAPIWAAFRTAYETLPDWDPFWNRDQPAGGGVAIPSAPLLA